MDDIRKGVCPLCKHNEIVVAPILQAQIGIAGLLKPPGFTICACRRCGYFQPFFTTVADVLIDDKFGTKLIKGPEPEGPYRQAHHRAPSFGMSMIATFARAGTSRIS
jgi:hypothetical protein